MSYQSAVDGAAAATHTHTHTSNDDDFLTILDYHETPTTRRRRFWVRVCVGVLMVSMVMLGSVMLLAGKERKAALMQEEEEMISTQTHTPTEMGDEMVMAPPMLRGSAASSGCGCGKSCDCGSGKKKDEM